MVRHHEPDPVVDMSKVRVRYDTDGNTLMRAKTIDAARLIALMHAEDVKTILQMK